ncbi:MAG: HAD family hydrolase [Granulosicoccus sp.]
MTSCNSTSNESPIDFTPDTFDAILFDCDGTLVNSAPLHFESFRLALEVQGAILDEIWYRERLSLSRVQLIQSFAKQCSSRIDVDTVVTQSEIHFLRLVQHMQVLPEVAAVVNHYWNIKPMAVVSSGQRLSVLASLDAIRLRHKFDLIIAEEDVQEHKPSPQPYLTAAKKMNVSPRRCLIFEDTDDGLISATQAGAMTIDVRMIAKLYASS